MRMSCSCHENAGGEAKRPDRPEASNVLYLFLGMPHVAGLSTACSMLLHIGTYCRVKFQDQAFPV